MFKKTEPQIDPPDTSKPSHAPEPELRGPPPAATGRREAQPAPSATIGPSIEIRGDMSGEEDLVVQGSVEGTIGLRQNLVTIGQEGRVNATVNARIIVVEGHVEGDLNGAEQVILRQSARVEGNIVSPRVTLEDGCRFKGSIDMDVESGEGERGAPRSANVADLKLGGDDPSRAQGADQQALLK